jgi:hypothetical protein
MSNMQRDGTMIVWRGHPFLFISKKVKNAQTTKALFSDHLWHSYYDPSYDQH